MNKILTDEVLQAYSREDSMLLPDINAEGILLRHKRSGARVLLIPCDDDNKVFYIGFRTPPSSSSGTAHIMEHSVLCGSRDFPVRDPFVELAKGSMNTFLNAMTYPDKTLYPVASCNHTDFRNLMHVYLDAVFFPAVLNEPNIFRQEGWRYEYDESTDSLSYNGVVYNEMKGALASGEDVLEREIQASLFPGSPYAYESGGDPAVIPALSYEEFCEFHRRYYHPANSYIYLYGDMDMAERLLYMDREYLSCFRAEDSPSVSIEVPEADAPNECTAVYSLLPDEDREGKAFMALNFALKEASDLLTHMTVRVLDYVLCDAEGAPLKEALRRSGIAEEVYSVYDSSALCPTYSVICRYCSEDAKDDFLAVTEQTLKEQVTDGIDPEAILSALSYFEFKYKEADFGSYPRGLVFGLETMDSWLYNEKDPWSRLNAGRLYSVLREKIGTGYFEQVLERLLLENRHRSVVTVSPVPGYSLQKEEEVRKALADMFGSLDEACREELIRAAADFEVWQNTPDTEEALATIPMLSVDDIEKKARLPVSRISDISGVPFISHDYFAGGIDYVTLLFDAGHLPREYYGVLGVLKTVLMAMDTTRYTYRRLDQRIHITTGGMYVCTGVYEDAGKPDGYRYTFELGARCFHSGLADTLDLAAEILLDTDFSDGRRLYEILEEERAGLRQSLASAGHLTAMNRAMSYFNPAAAFSEITGGIENYRYLDHLLNHFEELKEQLVKDLKDLCLLLFSRGNLTADLTAAKEDALDAVPAFEAFLGRLDSADRSSLPEHRDGPAGFSLSGNERPNEAFQTAGEVQFVCVAGDYKKAGFQYSGALRVLRVILGYDYLWNMVRVKGGAYGCMSSFGRDGTAFMVSYRDPNLLKTLETFRQTPEYLNDFEADKEAMTRYIIGAVSTMDQPMTPKQLGKYSLNCYIAGISDEQLQRERDEILSADEGDIRSLSALVKAVLDEGYLCTVGSREAIDEAVRQAAGNNGEIFGSVAKLF